MGQNILLVSPDFEPSSGGIAELSYQMAEGLCGRGKNVTVFTSQHNSFDFSDYPFGVKKCLPKPPAGVKNKLLFVAKLPRQVRWLAEYVKSNHIDYIFVTSWLGMFRTHILSKCNCPVGYYFHGDDVVSMLDARGSKLRIQSYIKKAENVFCNSRFTAGKLRALCNGDIEPIVTGCGINVEQMTPASDREESRKHLGISKGRVLLTVGRLVPRKGVDMVIRSMPYLKQRFPDVMYIIAGDGLYRQQLEQLVDEMNLRNCVRFEGRFEQNLLADYYNAADIFIMPSRYIPGRSVEGFGIVFLEAGFYGLPVVGGDSGGVPDAVVHEHTGLLVNPESTEDIGRSVERLFANPSWAQQLGQNGRQRVLESYNWSNIVRKVDGHIDVAIKNQGA
jgi:phosphatidyl-myo-inositol dimannoside synthase